MVAKADLSCLILDCLDKSFLAVEKFAVVLALFFAAIHSLIKLSSDSLEGLRDTAVDLFTLAGFLDLVLVFELLDEGVDTFDLGAAGVDPLSCLVEVAIEPVLFGVSARTVKYKPAEVISNLMGVKPSNVASKWVVDSLCHFIL